MNYFNTVIDGRLVIPSTNLDTSDIFLDTHQYKHEIYNPFSAGAHVGRIEAHSKQHLPQDPLQENIKKLQVKPTLPDLLFERPPFVKADVRDMYVPSNTAYYDAYFNVFEDGIRRNPGASIGVPAEGMAYNPNDPRHAPAAQQGGGDVDAPEAIREMEAKSQEQNEQGLFDRRVQERRMDIRNLPNNVAQLINAFENEYEFDVPDFKEGLEYAMTDNIKSGAKIADVLNANSDAIIGGLFQMAIDEDANEELDIAQALNTVLERQLIDIEMLGQTSQAEFELRSLLDTKQISTEDYNREVEKLFDTFKRSVGRTGEPVGSSGRPQGASGGSAPKEKTLEKLKKIKKAKVDKEGKMRKNERETQREQKAMDESKEAPNKLDEIYQQWEFGKGKAKVKYEARENAVALLEGNVRYLADDKGLADKVEKMLGAKNQSKVETQRKTWNRLAHIYIEMKIQQLTGMPLDNVIDIQRLNLTTKAGADRYIKRRVDEILKAIPPRYIDPEVLESGMSKLKRAVKKSKK